MKIFKIILILALLFSLSFVVCGEYTWQDEYGGFTTGKEEIGKYWRYADETIVFLDTSTNDGISTPLLEDDKHKYEIPWTEPEDEWVVIKKAKLQPDTLLGWFKDLTLDEKVEIYDWWKNESVKIEEEPDIDISIDDFFIYDFQNWSFRDGTFFVETQDGKWFIEMQEMKKVE